MLKILTALSLACIVAGCQPGQPQTSNKTSGEAYIQQADTSAVLAGFTNYSSLLISVGGDKVFSVIELPFIASPQKNEWYYITPYEWSVTEDMQREEDEGTVSYSFFKHTEIPRITKDIAQAYRTNRGFSYEFKDSSKSDWVSSSFLTPSFISNGIITYHRGLVIETEGRENHLILNRFYNCVFPNPSGPITSMDAAEDIYDERDPIKEYGLTEIPFSKFANKAQIKGYKRILAEKGRKGEVENCYAEQDDNHCRIKTDTQALTYRFTRLNGVACIEAMAYEHITDLRQLSGNYYTATLGPFIPRAYAPYNSFSGNYAVLTSDFDRKGYVLIDASISPDNKLLFTLCASKNSLRRWVKLYYKPTGQEIYSKELPQTSINVLEWATGKHVGDWINTLSRK